MTREAAIQHAHAHREDYLRQLLDLLRIPSISTLSEHKADVERAAQWLAVELRRVGLSNVQVMPTGGHPVVYADWLGAGPTAPTVLVYGHYDVQPVDPLELWHIPPFEPQVRDGLIYARGASDDKGQVYLQIKAIESMLAAEGRLPVNIRLLFEGEEESGSKNLAAFVIAHRDQLAADSVLVSDTGFIRADLPTIVYSLRGIVGAEVRVTGPKRDLHSGGYGGTVHNPVLALVEMLVRLHNPDGSVAIPGFYDDVRPMTDAEREALQRFPYTLEQWQEETGLVKPWGEPGYSLIERMGRRPTCEINGIFGGFQGEGTKTIIPASAGAKITMRLVSDQSPERIGQLFKDYVLSIAPDDVKVEVQITEGGWPLVTPIESPQIEAAARACQAVWGVRPVFMPGGGSIAVMAVMQQELHIPIVLMGFGVPDSNAHAPNEFFPVEQFYRGIDAVIHYCHNLAL